MYELYTLGQAWVKLFAKAVEPAINNPMVDWYMDQWTEVLLKSWFWPGQMATVESQINEFFAPFVAGNICHPK